MRLDNDMILIPFKFLVTRNPLNTYISGMGAPPRGEGGVPRPAPHCGEGGVPRPAPPRKNDQNRGEVAGQNIGPNLNFIS